MAGDGQMDPADLPGLLAPVVSGQVDYAKGNRFAWPGGWRTMPPVRLLGGAVLSWLTRLASGYWHVGDSQCGYTVASRQALARDRPASVRALRLPERSADAARGRARARRRRAGAAGVRPALAFGAAPAARGAADRAAAAARRSRGACARALARPAAPVVVDEAAGVVDAVMNIGVVTTSFPRHAGDYAGSFVGDRVRRCSRTGTRSTCWRRATGAARIDAREIEHARLTVTRIAPGPSGEREN